jgi:hypothetical protein
VALPRVDVGTATVQEGDSGSRTYEVPVDVSGSGTGELNLYLLDPVTGDSTSREVAVTPGTTSIRLPVPVTGDRLYGVDERRVVSAKAVSGTLIGSYEGGLTVVDEDVLPALTMQPVAQSGELRFRVTLAGPAETAAYLYLRPRRIRSRSYPGTLLR